MAEAPGARFRYTSGGSHVLAAIVTNATGRGTLDFAREHLFAPLGITDVGWPTDPQGIAHGWGDLRLTPHDMAKLGYLFLHQGAWDGKQVVSPEWVDAATGHGQPPRHRLARLSGLWLPVVGQPVGRLQRRRSGRSTDRCVS
jgi:CubicO group peptidase (beta-lactamase class C family)